MIALGEFSELEVITNRGDYITTCENKYTTMLKIDDVVEMLKLWKSVATTDNIIEFMLFCIMS